MKATEVLAASAGLARRLTRPAGLRAGAAAPAVSLRLLPLVLGHGPALKVAVPPLPPFPSGLGMELRKFNRSARSLRTCYVHGLLGTSEVTLNDSRRRRTTTARPCRAPTASSIPPSSRTPKDADYTLATSLMLLALVPCHSVPLSHSPTPPLKARTARCAIVRSTRPCFFHCYPLSGSEGWPGRLCVAAEIDEVLTPQ